MNPRETGRIFDRVIGGEYPLSDAEARLWLEGPAQDNTAPGDALVKMGFPADASLWLRYGRSALGLALKLAGINKASGSVCIPDYQCSEVLGKLRATTGEPSVYPLKITLLPDLDRLADCMGNAEAVITCSYFGAASVDQGLFDTGAFLSQTPEHPWIIEDRVMSFPAMDGGVNFSARCDFAIFSLRKTYPVPDGAVLYACSDRARDALSGFVRNSEPPGLKTDDAIREKVMAKNRRYSWLNTPPIYDDLARNGLKESVASEMRVNDVANNTSLDALPGTAASARYLLSRDPDRDRVVIARRSRVLFEKLSECDRAIMPFEACLSTNVPLLVDGRSDFLADAKNGGLFLPVHWPREETIKTGSAADNWYRNEVSIPVLPQTDEADFQYLVDTLMSVLGK